eukprot:GDKI01034139.1.p1 GENE.GDKI01034139.1~~GDKI01034139.1.p1  ORF type:complete len:114 (+),score=7.81 GDKI01034139.1:143-484(+)
MRARLGGLFVVCRKIYQCVCLHVCCVHVCFFFLRCLFHRVIMPAHNVIDVLHHGQHDIHGSSWPLLCVCTHKLQAVWGALHVSVILKIFVCFMCTWIAIHTYSCMCSFVGVIL